MESKNEERSTLWLKSLLNHSGRARCAVWFGTVLVIGLLCGVVRAEDDEAVRVWRSSKGAEISAALIRQGGGRAVLKRDSGEQVSILISALSASDRAYLKDLADKDRALTDKEKEEARENFYAKRQTGSKEPKAPRADDVDADWMSDTEKDVIREMNRVRNDPVGYVQFLEQYKATHIGEGVFRTNRGDMKTKEGPAAVQEAIDFLKQVKPVPALAPSRGLSLAAKVHVDDIGPAGIVGHEGTDGSTSKQRIEEQGRWDVTMGENIAFGHGTGRDIVMQLVIDDGVTNRGHRTNIFTRDYRVAGVAIGDHRKYGTMCVIDYAGGFSD